MGRMHKLSILLGWFSRALNSILQFLIIPITITYLNIADYAVFNIIIGVAAWFALADFGFGSCIQNQISKLRASNFDITTLLSSISVFLLGLVIIEITVFSFFAGYLQNLLFGKLFYTPSHNLLLIVATFYIFQFICAISYRVYFAIHKGYMVYIFQTLGILGTALSIWIITTKANLDNKLLMVCMAYIVPQTVAAFCAYLFAVPIKLSLSVTHLRESAQTFKKLIPHVLKFQFSALTTNFILCVDYIIISQVISDYEIVEYNFLNRIFNLLLFMYSTALLNIWPIIAEKFANIDKDKLQQINKVIIKSIFYGIVVILVFMVGLLLSKPLLLKFVLHNKVSLSTVYILLFTFCAIIRVWADTYAMILQAANRLKIFIIYSPIQGIINITLMLILGNMFKLSGILVGLALSYLLTAAWILPYYFYRHMHAN